MTTDANELVIGLVGPVGCDLVRIEDAVGCALPRFRYEARLYKLSRLFDDKELQDAVDPVDTSSEYDRLRTAMDAGDAWREKTGQPDIMAIHAISEIANARGPDPSDARPLDRVAHVLHSLKRPEEVRALREAYGQRFMLLSVYVPREDRVARLVKKGIEEPQAVELVARDEEGRDDFGQATSNTFQLADLFLDGRGRPEDIETEVVRFLDLLFGSRLVTPRRNEHAMFMAFASSLRSGDLSRQIGAVIADEQGGVLAMGCNDAPQFGGGQYWPSPGDARDLALGEDSNDRIRRQMVRSMLERVDRWDPAEEAFELHGDSVSANELVESRLRMLPFVGIGPRRYSELFGMQDRSGGKIKRKGDGGRVVGWDPGTATPILSESLVSYIDREKRATALMMKVRKQLVGDHGHEAAVDAESDPPLA